MLQAFVTNRSGRMLPVDNDGFVLQRYNLYRSYDNADYQLIAVVPSVEGQAFYQYKDLLLEDEHNVFYYKLTALYLSDDGEECESDYAASLLNPEQQFVMIDDHWEIAENQLDKLLVYPNPSSGHLSIKADGMRHVSVFNALGQRVVDREVQDDALQLDLSGFTNGVYQLRVTTEIATVSKRFVLSR